MTASRLKGKPLLEINKLPIICHVLNKANETGLESDHRGNRREEA